MKPGLSFIRTVAGVAAVSLVISASQLQAALLSPGGTVIPVPADLVSGTQVDQVILPYVGADILGTLTSSVIQNDTYNPLGGLTFTYLIMADPGSAAAVSRFTVGNYGGFQTDVAYSLMNG